MKKDKKLADTGSTKPIPEAPKEPQIPFFTLEETEELIYKKSKDKIVDLSTDFYKQKFIGKCMNGIPLNLAEFMVITESRLKAIRSAYNEKRQLMIQGTLDHY